MIKLSPRLKQIANYVEDHAIIDIGCDHGLLDVYLAETKENIQIIASDINQNALNNAKKNIHKYHVEDKVTTILSDGLKQIDPGSISTLIISGMGSHTIAGILYQSQKKLKTIQTLILQSNNDLDFLRYKVTKLGYYIEKEELVRDAGIIYTIIVFRKGHRFYTKKQLYFGPCLLKENTSLFQEKCQTELKKLEAFYPMIPKNHYHHRRVTKNRIKILRKILLEK